MRWVESAHMQIDVGQRQEELCQAKETERDQE
jgi:hypothetical protein